MGTGTTVHVSVVPGRAIFRACRSCRHESGTTGSITEREIVRQNKSLVLLTCRPSTREEKSCELLQGSPIGHGHLWNNFSGPPSLIDVRSIIFARANGIFTVCAKNWMTLNLFPMMLTTTWYKSHHPRDRKSTRLNSSHTVISYA